MIWIWGGWAWFKKVNMVVMGEEWGDRVDAWGGGLNECNGVAQLFD